MLSWRWRSSRARRYFMLKTWRASRRLQPAGTPVSPCSPTGLFGHGGTTSTASRGTGKAIVALARKFLGIIYRTLKNRWVFADFPNFVLAEEVKA